MNTATYSTATASEVQANKHNALLLDVRTPAEFEEMHIDGATLRPLHDLNPEEVRQLAQNKSASYVICKSGNRARQAAERLAAAGLSSVKVLEGGVLGWEREGLPLTRGQTTISLERQVRIAAGILILIGATLGYFVNPLWIGLCAFVGAGLTFAGVTDTCGMAMMLARMPWNTRSTQKNSGESCCRI